MRSSRTINAFALALASFLIAASAHATVTINGIDESRVSAYEGLTTGSTQITIYGGTAGTCTNDVANSQTATCSSCLAVTNSTADNQLLPCNDRRINPMLIMNITVTSSDHDGYPFIATGTTTTTGGTAANTILTDALTPRPTTLVTKGSTATVSIPWRAVCAAMTTSSSTSGGTSGGTPTNCDLGTADYATATFSVGVAANATETTTTSSDDLTSVTIVLRKGETTGSSSIATASGITYFEMYSGDNKGTIGALQSASNSGFPVYQNIRFRWIRILFEQRDDASKDSSSGAVWNKINSGSPHVDLEIQSTATDVNNLNLSPIIVQSGTGLKADGTSYSVSVSNDHAYDTKVAVVDEARNVAFYTPASNDQVCQDANGNTNENARSPKTGLLECHTLRPAVVVGVLSNKVNCFIATASYGSPMANEVDTFRHFRDTYLIPNKLGLKFVRWYYNEGPKYAHFIRQNDSFRAIARGLLWLPLQFAKVSLNYGLAAGFAFLFTALFAPLGLIYIFIRKSRVRSATNA